MPHARMHVAEMAPFANVPKWTIGRLAGNFHTPPSNIAKIAFCRLS
jgi:hypothetical protein